MLYGIGVDILHIDRIKALSSDYDDPFFRKTFTEKEREQALARPVPYLGFCTKFSAKEAVLKALKCCETNWQFRSIEVLNDKDGAPYVVLHDEVKTYAAAQGIIHIDLSASYDTDYVVTTAICTKQA